MTTSATMTISLNKSSVVLLGSPSSGKTSFMAHLHDLDMTLPSSNKSMFAKENGCLCNIVYMNTSRRGFTVSVVEYTSEITERMLGMAAHLELFTPYRDMYDHDKTAMKNEEHALATLGECLQFIDSKFNNLNPVRFCVVVKFRMTTSLAAINMIEIKAFDEMPFLAAGIFARCFLAFVFGNAPFLQRLHHVIELISVPIVFAFAASKAEMICYEKETLVALINQWKKEASPLNHHKSSMLITHASLEDSCEHLEIPKLHNALEGLHRVFMSDDDIYVVRGCPEVPQNLIHKYKDRDMMITTGNDNNKCYITRNLKFNKQARWDTIPRVIRDDDEKRIKKLEIKRIEMKRAIVEILDDQLDRKTNLGLASLVWIRGITPRHSEPFKDWIRRANRILDSSLLLNKIK